MNGKIIILRFLWDPTNMTLSDDVVHLIALINNVAASYWTKK